MKKSIKLTIGSLCLILIALFVSCEEKASLEPNLSSSSSQAVGTANAKPTVGIGINITGKPYRSTTSRPRDGKNCGCSTCFGVCELEFDIDIDIDPMVNPGSENGGGKDKPAGHTNIFVKILSAGQSEMYFLEYLPNFDSEFGIDKDLIIPMRGLVQNTGRATSVKLKRGEYSFVQETGAVEMSEGRTATYYGKVTVNSELH